MKDRIGAMVTLKGMLVHATDDLHVETAKKTPKMIVGHCVALRARGSKVPEDTNRHAPRSVEARWIAHKNKIIGIEAQIEQLVLQRAPHLLDGFGTGKDAVAEIVVVAGDSR